MGKPRIIECKVCGKSAPNYGHGMCRKCCIDNKPASVCSKCGKTEKIKAKSLCAKCYDSQYSKPKKVCKRCGRLDVNVGHGLCYRCYAKPEHSCKICGFVGVMDTKEICRVCANKNKGVMTCAQCGKEKPDKGYTLCEACYRRNRKSKESSFRLDCYLRDVVAGAFKRTGDKKCERTEKILGCSSEQFREMLGERPEGWHLDHICPMSQAQTSEEKIALCHYSNFQWLSAEENQYKSDKKTPEGEENCRRLLGREWIEG